MRFAPRLTLILGLLLAACSRSGEVTNSTESGVSVRLTQGEHTPLDAQHRAEEVCGSYGKRPQFASMATERANLMAHIIRYDFLCLPQT